MVLKCLKTTHSIILHHYYKERQAAILTALLTNNQIKIDPIRIMHNLSSIGVAKKKIKYYFFCLSTSRLFELDLIIELDFVQRKPQSEYCGYVFTDIFRTTKIYEIMTLKFDLNQF